MGKKEEVKETELIKEPFVKVETILMRVSNEPDKVVVVYEDIPLKEFHAEVLLRNSGKRFFLKDAKDNKELKKKLLAILDEADIDLTKLSKEMKEIRERIDELILEKGGIAVAGALVNQTKIYPFTTFNAEQAIQSLINYQKVEKINQEIENLQALMNDNETENPVEPYKKELERLYAERRKMFQPYLPLAIKTTDNGEYIQPNSLYRLGENLNRAVEGGNVVLLVPLVGIAQGRLTYRRLGIIPSTKPQTSVFRKRLYIYYRSIEALEGGKLKEALNFAERDKALERRLKQIIEFWKTATEEEREEIIRHKEQIEKALNILDGILFPKWILNPFNFDHPADEEGFKAFVDLLREAEKRIEELLNDYNDQLLKVAKALKKLEGRKIKVKTDEGVEEKTLKAENLKTKDIFTSALLRKIASKVGVDLDAIADDALKEVSVLSPDGKEIAIGGNVYSFINQRVGVLYLQILQSEGIKQLEEDDELKRLKEYIDEFVKTGRKPFERKERHFEVEIPDIPELDIDEEPKPKEKSGSVTVDLLLDEEEDSQIEPPKGGDEDYDELDDLLF